MHNYVCLIGNVTRDIELRYLPTGTPVADFSLAVNHTYKDKEGNKKSEPYFANITVFGKTAENCSQYLTKGSPALVEGRITEERWESEGQKRSKTKIIASNVRFLGSKGHGKSEEALPPEEHIDLDPF